MRLFIAVNFDDEIKNWLLDIQARIKAQSGRGNFSRPENLHLTLVFLGNTSEDQVPLIRKAVHDAAAGQKAFTLGFNRTGCFRHSNKELWWIGAGEADPGLPSLNDLRQRLIGGLRAAGIGFDERPFNAHITLGREIKHSASIEAPTERITIPVNRISLMNSENIQGVLVYTEISGQDLK
jgi:2'-5' RNA ligase